MMDGSKNQTEFDVKTAFPNGVWGTRILNTLNRSFEGSNEMVVEFGN